MASLSFNKRYIAVTCGTKALILNTDDGNGSNIVLEPPNLSGQSADCGADHVQDTAGHNLKEGGSVSNTSGDTPAAIVLASFSSCNTWLVLCSNNKQLSLWTTSDWSLVSNRCIVRTASAVKFTSNSHFIVVADKSGDAYTYSVEDPLAKGILILGHLSMLLDVVVTANDKYIITCDRDEKIRVSNFPNGYSIMTYCLGHEQFVSKIDLLPHNSSILVSSSGDGTIRFWNYESGNCIHIINCWGDSTGNDTDISEVSPVKSFTSCRLSDQKSAVCALIAGTKRCIVYHVFHEPGNVIRTKQCQILSFDVDPWDVILTEDKLIWVLSPSQGEIIRVYTLNESSEQFVINIDALNKKTALAVAFVQERRDWFNSISPTSSLSVLYKRKYDNLLVYHERKKLRTLVGSSTAVQSATYPKAVES